MQIMILIERKESIVLFIGVKLHFVLYLQKNNEKTCAALFL